MKTIYKKNENKEYKADYETINKNGEVEINPILPTAIEEFRQVAFDTLDFNMKKIAKEKADNVVASAKVDVLIIKLLNVLKVDTSTLTANEKIAFDNMTTLASNGYSDSLKIVDATQGILDVITLAQTKAKAIANAKTNKAIWDAL